MSIRAMAHSLRHHAFVIEAEAEEGIEAAQAWAKENLGMDAKANPDFVVLRYGLLPVEEARQVAELAAGAPFAGDHKVVIIVASRAYHEAQNALLKLFEEPPSNTYLFLVLPTLGSLLPTLRSRVVQLATHVGHPMSHIPQAATEFIKADRAGRSAIIKKLTSGKDDDERRQHRDEALSLISGVEALAYAHFKNGGKDAELLSDIAALRMHLYDRSAPVKMILEHLSLVIPKHLR